MGNILDDLSNSVSQAWKNVTSTGVPAVMSGIEQYGAQQLQQMAGESRAQAQAAANQVVSSPAPSSGVAQSINSVLNGIASNAVLKQYGVYILVGGVVAILVIRRL